ncbi:MAG: DUF2306 domain-containing protein [Pseudomonadota bacterium]|nr:DUF2306 domain-containing protein [Pseudomonadota bacterium]
MLGLGAAALYIGWTRRAFRRHRWFGYAYLGVGSLGTTAALGLSALSPHEPASLYVATGTLSAAWLLVAAMAWRAARNRRFDSHRDWMVRSYVLSWTFVGCRMANVLNLFPSPEGEAVTAQIWMFWIVPYLLCEMALQWKRGSVARPAARTARSRPPRQPAGHERSASRIVRPNGDCGGRWTGRASQKASCRAASACGVLPRSWRGR